MLELVIMDLLVVVPAVVLLMMVLFSIKLALIMLNISDPLKMVELSTIPAMVMAYEMVLLVKLVFVAVLWLRFDVTALLAEIVEFVSDDLFMMDPVSVP